MLKEGGSKRREVVDQAIKSVGGRLESFYYALGEHDVYVIAEFPDLASAIAHSAAVTASGATKMKTIPLLSVEEVDEAVRKNHQYRPPGK